MLGVVLIAAVALPATASGRRSEWTAPNGHAQEGLTIAAAEIRGTWRESALTGRFRLAGTAAEAVRLSISLDHRTKPARVSFPPLSVPAGAFDIERVLPRNMRPGEYVVVVEASTADGRALPAVTSAATLEAPPEGVVGRIWVNGRLYHGVPPRIPAAAQSFVVAWEFLAWPTLRPVVLYVRSPRGRYFSDSYGGVFRVARTRERVSVRVSLRRFEGLESRFRTGVWTIALRAGPRYPGKLISRFNMRIG